MLVNEFKGKTFGAITVLDAREAEGPMEAGRQIIYLDLVLSDPEGDRLAAEDVRALRQKITDLAKSLGISISMAHSTESNPRYRFGPGASQPL